MWQVSLSSGLVTVGTNNDKSGYGLADGAITAAKLASDAITADKIAANAIGASELASDAVTEIQAGLSTLDAAGVRTAVGLASANLDSQLSAIQADLDNPNQYKADVSGLSTLDAAGVRTAVGLASANLDTQMGNIYADTQKVGGLVENVGGNRFTAKALEEAPAGEGGGGGLVLADFFLTDTGETAGTAVSGSVVGEIVASITGGGIPGAIEVDDLAIDDGDDPLAGVDVWITTDEAGGNVVWRGVTDAFGNPRNGAGNHPLLDAGTYYVWCQLAGYVFSNPTEKVVA